MTPLIAALVAEARQLAAQLASNDQSETAQAKPKPREKPVTKIS
jgi:hypothetical protein